MSRRHYSYLTEPQFGRSKRIKVWKNGDPYNDCYEFLINPKVFRTWNCVLRYITDVIRPEFGAVRRLVSLTSKRSICCFEDLNPNDKYVAVGLNSLKIIKSGYKTPSEIALKNKSKIKKPYYVGEFYQPKFKFLQLTKRKGLTIIYLVVNKKVCQVPMKMVLNEKDFSNWDVTLRYIDKMLDIPTGIQRICTIFGDVIDDPHTLQHGYVYVAVPCDEKFVSIDYMALFQNFFHPITSYTVSIKPAKGARVIEDPFKTEKIEKKKLELPFAQYDLGSTRDLCEDISSYQCGCHCQHKSPKKTVSHPIAGRFPFPRRTKLKRNYSKQMPPIQEDPKENYAPSLCEDDDDNDDEAEAVVNFQTETLWKQFLTTAHSSAENNVLVSKGSNTNTKFSTGANDEAVRSPRKSSIRTSKECTSPEYSLSTEERKKSSLKQVSHQLDKECEALTRSSPNSTDDSNSLRKSSMKKCSCEDVCSQLKICSSEKCRSGNIDELSRKSSKKSSSKLYKEEVHSSTRSSLSNANDRNSSRKSSLKKSWSNFRSETNEMTASSLSKADDQRSLEKFSSQFDAPRTLINVNNCNSLRSSLEKERSNSTSLTSKRSSDIRRYSPIRMGSILDSILEHIAISTDEQQTISSKKSSLKYFERRSSLKNDILKELETENEENIYVDIWTKHEDDVEDKPPFTQSQFATDEIQPTTDKSSILKKHDNDVVEAETMTSICDVKVQNTNNPSTVLRVDSACRLCCHRGQQEKRITSNLGRDQEMTISENADCPELNTTNEHVDNDEPFHNVCIGSQCGNTSKPLVVKKKSERVSISSQTDTSTLQPKQHNTDYKIKLKSGSTLGFNITPLLQSLPNSSNMSSNMLNSSNEITKISANKLENTEQEKEIEFFSDINDDPKSDDKCSIMSEDSIEGND